MPQLYRLARQLLNVRREQQLRRLWSHFVPVRHRSSADNVYHCCVWKTASQWIRNVFSATAVYRYSGLLTYAYEHFEGRDDRSLQVRTFDRPFPLRTIVSPLYINYESFATLPKPASYRAFFVVRDPRDLVVSHYFSSRYSHVENPGVLEERGRLAGLSEEDGMLVHMEYMVERGIFQAIHSWSEQSHGNPNVRVFRFEDLVGPGQLDSILKLMQHCDIRIPREDLEPLLSRLSFKRLSGGRKQGEENKHHKYRSGAAGDWKKYFSARLHDRFEELVGDLPNQFGYEAADRLPA
jgi:hypothetical protein